MQNFSKLSTKVITENAEFCWELLSYLPSSFTVILILWIASWRGNIWALDMLETITETIITTSTIIVVIRVVLIVLLIIGQVLWVLHPILRMIDRQIRWTGFTRTARWVGPSTARLWRRVGLRNWVWRNNCWRSWVGSEWNPVLVVLDDWRLKKPKRNKISLRNPKTLPKFFVVFRKFFQFLFNSSFLWSKILDEETKRISKTRQRIFEA